MRHRRRRREVGLAQALPLPRRPGRFPRPHSRTSPESYPDRGERSRRDESRRPTSGHGSASTCDDVSRPPIPLAARGVTTQLLRSISERCGPSQTFKSSLPVAPARARQQRRHAVPCAPRARHVHVTKAASVSCRQRRWLACSRPLSRKISRTPDRASQTASSGGVFHDRAEQLTLQGVDPDVIVGNGCRLNRAPRDHSDACEKMSRRVMASKLRRRSTPFQTVALNQGAV